MKRAPRTSQPHNEHQTLPLEIYLPLVTSLYKDGRTLLVGTIVVTGSIFVTYWKTGDALLLSCAAAFVLVACARNIGLGLREHAPNNNKRRTRQAMGASLRRRSARIRWTAWHLVLSRILA